MKTKVLVTCPPMLKQIERFVEVFDRQNMEITTPKVVQTLSVDELLAIVPEHDGWIIGDDPATSTVFEAGKSGRLKAAVKWGIGTDNVDFEACSRLGIPITNTPSMFGAEVADLAMCYLLGLARDAFYIDREIRGGHWPKPAGVSLTSKTLGIVGLGDIGKNVAKRAHAHDLKVIGWDPFAAEVPSYIERQKSWPAGVERCDFVVLCCALTDETHHLINDKTLANFKTSAKLINVSRGPLIDERALLNALDLGQLCAAALDVFETEPLEAQHSIRNYPRCILGSHNGSNTIEGVERASLRAIELLAESLNCAR